RSLTCPGHQDRHTKVRHRLLADDDGPKLESAPSGVAVDDQRFARWDDPAGQAFAVLERIQVVPVLVGKFDDAGAAVEQRDIGNVRLENSAALLRPPLE